MKESLRDRIFSLMKDGRSRTLFEIREHVGGSDSGISAKLRDCRKLQHGGHTVECKCVNRGEQIYKYRLIVNSPAAVSSDADLLSVGGNAVDVKLDKARAAIGLEQQELF